jgi:hypothetical protein
MQKITFPANSSVPPVVLPAAISGMSTQLRQAGQCAQAGPTAANTCVSGKNPVLNKHDEWVVIDSLSVIYAKEDSSDDEDRFASLGIPEADQLETMEAGIRQAQKSLFERFIKPAPAALQNRLPEWQRLIAENQQPEAEKALQMLIHAINQAQGPGRLKSNCLPLSLATALSLSTSTIYQVESNCPPFSPHQWGLSEHGSLACAAYRIESIEGLLAGIKGKDPLFGVLTCSYRSNRLRQMLQHLPAWANSALRVSDGHALALIRYGSALWLVDAQKGLVTSFDPDASDLQERLAQQLTPYAFDKHDSGHQSTLWEIRGDGGTTAPGSGTAD